MKRIIDFQVSVGGQDSVVMRVEYESVFSSRDEMKQLKFPEAFKVMKEAEDALRKEIGHSDYVIEYWDWIE